MVLWIGVDDTDSLRGMCTTFLATELVRQLTQDHDLVGYPRLVRLNPNIPWKTRGNGAVCLRIGEGAGEARTVGRIEGRPILSYPRARRTPGPASVVPLVAGLVEKWSSFEDPTTNPAFVVLESRPPPGLYWQAGRGFVPRGTAPRLVEGRGTVRTYKNGRGVIGAAAATAWRPRDRTYEVLAYRAATRWGTRRDVDPTSVVEMDASFPSTFNNYDPLNGRVVIAPRSPCPVLFGIRGDSADELPAAMATIRGEDPDRWLVFETNQGTDDHVVKGPPFDPSTTVRFGGRVSSPPRSIPGGHWIVDIDGVEATAYEPAKQFRNIVRALLPGDRVEVIGAVRDAPRTLNLEKLRIDALIPAMRKEGNPECPRCRKRAKSLGRDAGFRCVRCGTRMPRIAARWTPLIRPVPLGWHEPPPGSRRHLSKPVKRMAAVRTQ